MEVSRFVGTKKRPPEMFVPDMPPFFEEPTYLVLINASGAQRFQIDVRPREFLGLDGGEQSAPTSVAHPHTCRSAVHQA
jgi:hypothetical protein